MYKYFVSFIHRPKGMFRKRRISRTFVEVKQLIKNDNAEKLILEIENMIEKRYGLKIAVIINYKFIGKESEISK